MYLVPLSSAEIIQSRSRQCWHVVVWLVFFYLILFSSHANNFDWIQVRPYRAWWNWRAERLNRNYTLAAPSNRQTMPIADSIVREQLSNFWSLHIRFVRQTVSRQLSGVIESTGLASFAVPFLEVFQHSTRQSLNIPSGNNVSTFGVSQPASSSREWGSRAQTLTLRLFRPKNNNNNLFSRFCPIQLRRSHCQRV